LTYSEWPLSIEEAVDAVGQGAYLLDMILVT